ncbi:MAG: DegQ family serine endoprotease [Desulfuromonadia bacterium]
MHRFTLRLLVILLITLFLPLYPQLSSSAPLLPDFVELARELKPAVVNISTAKRIKQRRVFPQNPFSPFGPDPFQDFFERFFEDQQPQGGLRQNSLGSGFIISDDGYILTNNHVISGADEISVKLTDGREFKAEIKGQDEKLDLALIRIKPLQKGLPTVRLGDSDDIRVGEWVMAIGNPFGLSATVTAGIISAKGRVIGSGPYDDYLQTDASINPGNSGGPLFNTRGEVIGINTAIIAGGQGIGFAIPINMAKGIIPQLKETGKVIRGWLGVSIQPVTPELSESFGLSGEKGALVSEVIPDSPADKGGIKAGDVIVTFDGKEIHEMNELPRIVATTPVGKEVTVKVIREGKPVEVRATVARLADDGDGERGADVSDRIGLTVKPNSQELAQHLRIRETRGIVVIAVKSDSPAYRAGIQRGDVIREVNGTKVTNVEEYEKALGKTGAEQQLVRFLVRRGDRNLFVAFKVE